MSYTKQTKQMDKYIYFNTRDTFFRIALSRIAYFEAEANYTRLHLTNQKTLIFTFNIGTMQSYLTDKLQHEAQCFVRIGKSVIINMNLLFRISLTKQCLELYDPHHDNTFTLTISKEALKALKTLYMKPDKAAKK